MYPERTVIVASDMVTPYGWGSDICWSGLLAGRTAIRPLARFDASAFQTQNAATIPKLEPDSDESLVMAMLRPLVQKAAQSIPGDSAMILATTTGEIEHLERHVLTGEGADDESDPSKLLSKLSRLCGVGGPLIVVSAACASSNAAVSRAAAMIGSGELTSVLVVACDSVSEFVMSGFSSLMALDEDKARPFDQSRGGLSLGEAAGYLLLMSEARADRDERPVLGRVVGWGMSSDANHMTGTSRDGAELAMAMEKALDMAQISPGSLACIAAHGTGTVFNDRTEMKAFKKLCGESRVPTYSIKGGTGHTLGTAGLVELIIALKTLEEKVIPPTVNLEVVDPDATGWVFTEPREIRGSTTISTSAGFGGINAVLVIEK